MIRLSDSKRRTRLLLALLLTASLVIITVDFRTEGDGVLDKIGRAAVTVLGPLQEGLRKIFRPVGGFFTGLGRVPSLQHRIELLERENALLRSSQEQVADVFRENARLRQLLAMRERLNLRTLPSQVIGIAPSNFERSVFIDAGTRDGVRRGMPVVGGEGLVGRVIAAGTSSSEVLLIVDRSSDVAGRLTATGETGVLEGSGTDLRFELLNPYAKVAIGDQVVTAGYDRGVYPAGIPIGRVSTIPPGRQSLSKVVSVRPLVDFSSLDYVLVILGEGETR